MNNLSSQYVTAELFYSTSLLNFTTVIKVIKLNLVEHSLITKLGTCEGIN